MSNEVASVPDWEDFESLPQLRAFVSETLRWRPVATIGEYFHNDDHGKLTFPYRVCTPRYPEHYLGMSHPLSIHNVVKASDIPERPMYSCGCNCLWVPLVNHWVFLCRLP